MASILITGGAGYIGRWLARELTTRDFEVVAFDRVTPEPGGPLALPAGTTFVAGDLTDPATMIDLAKQRPFSAIIHLAGIVTMGAERDPILGMRVNLGGTQNVLEAARQAGIPRVVFTSTISVYGLNLPQPITEQSPALPLTWYGQSKIMAEQLGLYYNRRWGLDFRAARLAAIVGPFRAAASGSATMYTTLIIEKAAKGEPYAVDVDEQAATPILYAKDAASALATLAIAPSAPRRIYNVSSGRASSVGLIELVKRKFPNAQITFRPEPALAEVARISHDWEIGVEAIGEDLGWKPAYPLQAIVDDISAIVRGEKAL